MKKRKRKTKSRRRKVTRCVRRNTKPFEDVRGSIIGGDFVAWRVYYDGRPQGQRQWADTEDKAISASKEFVKELKRENKHIGLYPDDSKWEVRIHY